MTVNFVPNSGLPWILYCTGLYFFLEKGVKFAHILIFISHTLPRRLHQLIIGSVSFENKKVSNACKLK